MDKAHLYQALKRLAAKAWPGRELRVQFVTHGHMEGAIEVFAPPSIPGAQGRVLALLDGGDRAHAALHAALLVLAGKEHPDVSKLRAELAAERKAKHDAREQVHVVMAAGEVAIAKLKRFDAAEARASSADMERALNGTPSTVPPAAEYPSDPRAEVS
jgi:hypothetical protein